MSSCFRVDRTSAQSVSANTYVRQCEFVRLGYHCKEDNYQMINAWHGGSSIDGPLWKFDNSARHDRSWTSKIIPSASTSQLEFTGHNPSWIHPQKLPPIENTPADVTPAECTNILNATIWKLTRAPDPVRPTRHSSDPNRPTRVTSGDFLEGGVICGGMSAKVSSGN